MEAGGPERVRVLVVDDEVDFVTALVTRLVRRGFDAVPAFSGPQALTRLRAAPADVVVLDLKMPGMDGLETLREMRRLDPHVQIVVLTGHGTVAAGIDGMQLGAADFLQKPTSIEQLCIAIEVAAIRARESRASAAQERGPG